MNRSFVFRCAAIASVGLQLTFGLASNAQSDWTRIASDPKIADGKPEAVPNSQQPTVNPPSMPPTNPIADPQVKIALQEVPQPTLPKPTAMQLPPVPPLPPEDRFFSALFSSPVVSRLYARADYMLWWAKGAPLGVPLISTGPIATTHHGWLDSSDTTILYGAAFAPAHGGDDKQNFPIFSAGKFTLGVWLDNEQTFGIEGSAFALERHMAGYEIRSNMDGLPIINIPLYNSVSYTPLGPGARALIASGIHEDGLPAALPNDPSRFDGNSGVFAGEVKIWNSLQLWGSDLTGAISLFRNSSWQLTALAGFRYLELAETFNLQFATRGISGFYANDHGSLSDTFQTRNQFFGGLLGLRARYSYGRLSIDMLARMAIGTSHEVLNIWGGFESVGYTGPRVTGPEGIFAQPANEGRTASNRFAVAPELQMKVGYAVTPWLRLTAGYDYLYLSSVVRPADQIDRNLPKGQTFQQGGSTASTTSPERQFVTSDFFVHGLSFGLDFRY